MAIYSYDWQIPGHWFDYYTFLGVKENAKEDEIKKAYRKIAKQYHPDLNPNNKVAEENLKKANIAYDILSDASKRAKYDNEYKQRKYGTNQNTYQQSHTSNQKSSQNTYQQSHTSNQKSSQNTYQQSYSSNQGNTQNTQQQYNNQNQSYSQDSQGYNDAPEDDNIAFDDIVEQYKKNPFDKEAKELLEKALQIIINSFKQYEKLVDETYRDFYSTLYNENMIATDYISTRDELKIIILEQIKTIKDFKEKYKIVMNPFVMKSKNSALNQMIKEYQDKLKRLSKTYMEALNLKQQFKDETLKGYWLNIELFGEEFSRRTKVIDQKFSELVERIYNKELIGNEKQEIELLLAAYHKIHDWIDEVFDVRKHIDIDISKKDVDRIEEYIENRTDPMYEKTRKLRELSDPMDKITYLTNLLKVATPLYQELKPFGDYPELERMVDSGKLNEINYKKIRDEFKKRYFDLCAQRRKVIYTPTNIVPIYELIKTKSKEFESILSGIDSLMRFSPIFLGDWSSLTDNIQEMKHQKQKGQTLKESELKAKELQKSLQPVIDFILNIDNKNISYSDFMKTESFKRIEGLITLCNEIKEKMESLPYFTTTVKDMNSVAYRLDADLKQTLNILLHYKKFTKKMASCETYITFCSNNDINLEHRFYDLKQSFQTLSGNPDNYYFQEYEKQVNKTSKILNEGKEILSGIGCNVLSYSLEYLDYNVDLLYGKLYKKLDSFYSSKGKNFNSHGSFRKLNFESCIRYNELKEEIENWIQSHSLQQAKKIQRISKLENIKKQFQQIVDTTQQLLNDRHQGKLIVWQQILHNKEVLEGLLDEVNEIIINKNAEQDSFESEYFELYQELRVGISKIPQSEEEFIEQLKLQTLELLNVYKENKKHVNELNTLSINELNNYIRSFLDYQIEVAVIKILIQKPKNENVANLEAQIGVYQNIIEEIANLKSKCSDAEKLENEYKEMLLQKQKALYYAQNEGKTVVDINLLWRMKELEEELTVDSLNENVILQYLEIVGRIAEEEYLQTHINLQGTIADTIRDIEAKKIALMAKKQALYSYSEIHNLQSSFQQQELITIEGEINDCDTQLSILKL